MAALEIRPSPKSFDGAILLLTEAKGRQDTCQNIQPGTNAIDIYLVKFQESVR